MNSLDNLDYMSENERELAFGSKGEGSSSQYTCPFCGKLIKNKSKIKWVNEHDKVLKCPGCGENIFWLK